MVMVLVCLVVAVVQGVRDCEIAWKIERVVCVSTSLTLLLLLRLCSLIGPIESAAEDAVGLSPSPPHLAPPPARL